MLFMSISLFFATKKVYLSFVAMIDMISLGDTEEVIALLYEKYLLSRKIKHWDGKISRSKVISDFYGADHQRRNWEGQKDLINIDYNTELQNILDEFLRSNQVSFEKFEVQCGDLVGKANECEKQLVEMETECHVAVEENQQVRSVSLYLKSQPTGFKETTHVQIYTSPSLRWESLNSKDLMVSAWEHLLLCI